MTTLGDGINKIDGSPYRWFIVPSKSLRDLVVRNYKRIYPWCNYIVLYQDVNGYGIELARASWVREGHTYIQD